MEKKLRGGTGANQHFSKQSHHLDEPALPTHKRLAKEALHQNDALAKPSKNKVINLTPLFRIQLKPTRI